MCFEKADVKEVTADEIILSDGRRIAYSFVVWAAGKVDLLISRLIGSKHAPSNSLYPICLSGNGPLPLVSSTIESIPEQSNLQKFGRGRLVTDSWCRVKGAPRVFAIGDCAVIYEKPLPANAQVISYKFCFPT